MSYRRNSLLIIIVWMLLLINEVGVIWIVVFRARRGSRNYGRDLRLELDRRNHLGQGIVVLLIYTNRHRDIGIGGVQALGSVAGVRLRILCVRIRMIVRVAHNNTR